jgi:hypothetical protein
VGINGSRQRCHPPFPSFLVHSSHPGWLGGGHGPWMGKANVCQACHLALWDSSRSAGSLHSEVWGMWTHLQISRGKWVRQLNDVLSKGFSTCAFLSPNQACAIPSDSSKSPKW